MADAALLRLDFALPFIAQLCTKVCLAAFSLSPNSDSPLTILSNRDEVHARPAAPVGWWRAGGEPLAAGRDLQAGGTWMAINKRLRWGIILNRPSESLGQKSRGELIPNWLDSDLDAASYLRQLKRQCGDYRPFSLIVGGLAGPVACLSTPSGEIYEYASGTSGFSNCEPGEGWGKIQALRDDLHASLQGDQGQAAGGVARSARAAGQQLQPRCLHRQQSVSAEPLYTRAGLRHPAVHRADGARRRQGRLRGADTGAAMEAKGRRRRQEPSRVQGVTG